MPSGRIDVHGHFLPAIDDGCRTFDESLACAQALVAAGYTHAFCTPHVWPQYPNNVVSQILPQVTALQERLDEQSIPLTLHGGGELNLMFCWPTLKQLPRDQIVTYDFAGKVVLFDFWARESSEYRATVLPAVKHLRNLGLDLVLAHPERLKVFHADPDALETFAELGVQFQLNSWCLTEPTYSPIYRLAERLLKDGRYTYLGTDTHSPAGMPPRISGLAIAEQLIGLPALREITEVNPARLFRNRNSL